MHGVAWIAAAATLSAGCRNFLVWRAGFQTPKEFAARPVDAPFVKIHLRDGRVYLLDEWSFDQEERVIKGQGTHFDAARRPLSEGTHRIPMGEVALIETNRPQSVTSPARIAGIA